MTLRALYYDWFAFIAETRHLRSVTEARAFYIDYTISIISRSLHTVANTKHRSEPNGGRIYWIAYPTRTSRGCSRTATRFGPSRNRPFTILGTAESSTSFVLRTGNRSVSRFHRRAL